MLSGEVVGLVRDRGIVFLTIKDAVYGTHVPLRVQEHDQSTGHAVTIGLGDRVSWEGNRVWWTSKTLLAVTPGVECSRAWEVPLPRVGYLR
jgi:hypothetical protein